MFGLVMVSMLACTHAQEANDANQALDLLGAALESIKSFDVALEVRISAMFKSEVVAPESRDKAGRLVPPVVKTRKLKPGEPTDMVHEHVRHVHGLTQGRFEVLDGPGGKPTKVVVYNGEREKSANVRGNEVVVRKPGIQIATHGDYPGDVQQSVRPCRLVDVPAPPRQIFGCKARCRYAAIDP